MTIDLERTEPLPLLSLLFENGTHLLITRGISMTFDRNARGNDPVDSPYNESEDVVTRHVTIVGYLFIALGIFGIAAAVALFVSIAGAGMIEAQRDAFLITSAVTSILATVIFFLSLPALIGGIGLLRRYNWARVMVIVLAFTNLLNIPFGTFVAIYAIWVLLHERSADLFQSGLPGPA